MPVEIKQLMIKGIMEEEEEDKKPSSKSSVPSMEMQDGGDLDYSVKKQIIDACVYEVMERIKKLNEL